MHKWCWHFETTEAHVVTLEVHPLTAAYRICLDGKETLARPFSLSRRGRFVLAMEAPHAAVILVDPAFPTALDARLIVDGQTIAPTFSQKSSPGTLHRSTVVVFALTLGAAFALGGTLAAAPMGVGLICCAALLNSKISSGAKIASSALTLVFAAVLSTALVLSYDALAAKFSAPENPAAETTYFPGE